jgi:hypothetical protein
VYRSDDGASGGWSQIMRITASDGSPSDQFGYSISMHEGLIAVGSRMDDTAGGTDAGEVYDVYEVYEGVVCCACVIYVWLLSLTAALYVF